MIPSIWLNAVLGTKRLLHNWAWGSIAQPNRWRHSTSDGTWNRTESADEDHEVARLRQRLDELEKQAANKAESRLRELTGELEEAETLIAQLHKK